MSYEVAVIVPVMRRPHRVVELLNSFHLSGHRGRAEMYFVADADDDDELEELNRVQANIIVNSSPVKTFAVKCNLGYRETIEPWLFFIGDDVEFHNGWLDAAFADDDGSAFISTNDMFNRGVLAGMHATHPLIRRSWIDEHGASWDGPGTVCHNGYRHWYVDNEWTAVAWAANQFRYAPEAVVEHLHPLAGKAESDEVYQLGQMHTIGDRQLYLSRLGRFAHAS